MLSAYALTTAAVLAIAVISPPAFVERRRRDRLVIECVLIAGLLIFLSTLPKIQQWSIVCGRD